MNSGASLRRLDESHALGLAALAGPIIAIYAPLGLAPLFALVCVAALAMGWHKRPWQRIDRPLLIATCLILAWAAISILWTINPPQALKTLVGVTGIFCGGLILVTLANELNSVQCRRVRLALVSGVGLALLLLTVELAGFGPGAQVWKARKIANMPYYLRLGRGLTVTQVLLPLAILAAWRMKWRYGVWGLAILGVIPPIMGHTMAAKVALLTSAAIVVLAFWSRRLPAFSALAMIIILALFPLLSQAPDGHATGQWGWLPNTAHHRLTIWRFTAGKTLEHPVTGWGLDAARDIPDAERIEIYRNKNLVETTSLNEQMLPLHPHNVSGHIWLELGGIGVIMLAGLIALAASRIQAQEHRVTCGLLTCCITSAFAISSVSYGIWQSWWLATLWFAAALSLASGKGDGVPESESLKQSDTVPEGSDAVS